VAWRHGDWQAARDHLQNGLTLAQECGDVGGLALAARHLAAVSCQVGEYDEAERWAQESQRGYQQAGDPQGLIAARNELGIVATMRGELEGARACYAANLAQAREMGDRLGAAQALNNLGTVAYDQGVYEEARAYYEQSRAVCEEIDDRMTVAAVLSNLGDVCIWQGQDGAAWDHLRRSLRETVASQYTPIALESLVHVSRLRLRAEQSESAAQLLGLALRHPASTSEVEWAAQPVLETLRDALGPDELEAALARGAEMALEQVVEEILAEG
jgi:tetratricopeptide (TPR) repeat protein